MSDDRDSRVGELPAKTLCAYSFSKFTAPYARTSINTFSSNLLLNLNRLSCQAYNSLHSVQFYYAPRARSLSTALSQLCSDGACESITLPMPMHIMDRIVCDCFFSSNEVSIHQQSLSAFVLVTLVAVSFNLLSRDISCRKV